MIPWLLLALTVIGFGLLIARDVREIHRATRKLEEETMDREMSEGLDIEPEDVVVAISHLVDIVGVDSVYLQRDSNVIYVLAAASVNLPHAVALKDTVRASVPIGLSARVVRTKEEIPDGCVVMARGWAA